MYMRCSTGFFTLILLCVFILLGTMSGYAEGGSMERKEVVEMSFPVLKAETLAGTRFQSPDPAQEETQIIIIAFRRGVQNQIDQWLDELAGPVSESPNIQMYEVPMLAKGWKLMSGVIDGGMRSGIPQEKHSSVATYYGDVRRYKDILDMENEELCYIYIVDPKGVIRFAAAGPPQPDLLQKARETLKKIHSP